MSANNFDTVIIGSGPAGVSCALELHRSAVNCVLLERGPKIADHVGSLLNTIENFPGGFYRNGAELQLAMTELLDLVGCKYLVNHEVTAACLQDRQVTAAGEEFRGKTILIATGYRRRQLDLPQLQEFPEDVTYSLDSGLGNFRGQVTVVLGGGDSACLDALDLARESPAVYLVNRSERFLARPDILESVKATSNIKIISNAVIESLVGEKRLQSVRIKTKAAELVEVPAQRLSIRIGYSPNTEAYKGQVDMDGSGHILINGDGSTSCKGIYAAGDIVRPGYPQIATSAGQGMIAAGAIRYLLER